MIGVDVRDLILARAMQLVGDKGNVRDYPCDCGGSPGTSGERFVVKWNNDPLPTCYNLDELEEVCKNASQVGALDASPVRGIMQRCS